MKQQESNKNRTDKAWKKLYKRLEEDELLHTKPSGHVYWRAAILLALVALTTLVMYLSVDEEQPLPALVSQHMEPAPIRTAILEDSSIVCLEEKASLEYPDTFDKDVREVSLEGNALFDVTGNPRHPFRIHIGTAQVEVLGTTFYIRSEGKCFSEAGVKNGRIKITIPEIGYPVYIGEGEKATLQGNHLHVSKVIGEDAISRYSRCLHFKDETLGRVLHVLNRLNLEAVCFEATPEVGERKLTFTYSNSRPEIFAELISTALGISYRTEGSTIIFME